MVINSWRLQRRWLRLQRPIAVALIMLGGFLVWAQGNAPPATDTTVVAAADIPAGRAVEESDVKVVQWPLANRPPAAARSPDELVGRRATSAITAGEPLTPARVASPTALASVGTDHVAVTMPAEALAASGLVRAGDRVNVVGAGEVGPRTLVSGATVLAVDAEQGLVVAVPSGNAASVVQAAATKSAAVVLLSG